MSSPVRIRITEDFCEVLGYEANEVAQALGLQVTTMVKTLDGKRVEMPMVGFPVTLLSDLDEAGIHYQIN